METNWNGIDSDENATAEEWSPFCLWCGRATDHTGEHEEYRLLGLTEDDYTTGMVTVTKLGQAVLAHGSLADQLAEALGRVWELKWKLDHGS